VQRLRAEVIPSARSYAGSASKGGAQTPRCLGWRPVLTSQPELNLADLSADQTCPALRPPAAPPPPPMVGADPNLSALRSSPRRYSPQLGPGSHRSQRSLVGAARFTDDAPPFGSARAVPRAGVLLAVPALLHSGLFDRAVVWKSGSGVLGLRTTPLTLLFMALWRIKRPRLMNMHPRTWGGRSADRARRSRLSDAGPRVWRHLGPPNWDRPRLPAGRSTGRSAGLPLCRGHVRVCGGVACPKPMWLVAPVDARDHQCMANSNRS
jgi:hypothetical protein